MGLLKKDAPKKDFSKIAKGGAAASQISALRPVQKEKLPPCVDSCPSGNKIRGWLTTIALRDKLGLSLEQAYTQAWMLEAETMPFPEYLAYAGLPVFDGLTAAMELQASVRIADRTESVTAWL